MKTKFCNKCKKRKTTKNFYKDRTKIDRLSCNCKNCSKKATLNWYYRNRTKQLIKMRKYYQKHKDNWPKRPKKKRRASEIKYRYGLTWDIYRQMLKQQKGKCAICNKKDSTGRRLSIDHNHKTGKIRGLLCLKCNRVLGLINDNVSIAKMMTKYLERWRK